MHHNLAVVEQVSYHRFKTPNILCMFLMLALPPYSKAFGKDPLDSDHQEQVNSDTESEQEESDNEHDTPKEDEKAGIVDSPIDYPLVSFKFFIFISKKINK